MSAELLPCPFCGASGEENYHKATESYYIACSKCTGHTCQHGAEQAEAAAEWNRRPAIAPPVAAGSVDKEEVAGFAMAALEEGQEWMRRAEKAEAELDTLKESLRLVNVDHGLWMARAHAAEDARDDALTRVKELETERQALQAEGKHPAPCARHCEANAYQIEVRRLVAVELDMHRKLAAEVLRADQGWARYEAANRAKNALEVTLAAR